MEGGVGGDEVGSSVIDVFEDGVTICLCVGVVDGGGGEDLNDVDELIFVEGESESYVCHFWVEDESSMAG